MPLPLTAVDLFAGAGGTTTGLKQAGFSVEAAVENDPDAARTYAKNHPEVRLLDRDIRRVQAPALARQLGARIGLLTACPPCQGFSTLGPTERTDPRNELVMTVARFVRHLRPWAILLENVPGLGADRRLRTLLASLGGYETRQFYLDAADFGVPQHRKRVIVVAIDSSFGGDVPERLQDLLPPTFDASPRTAWSALEDIVFLTQERDPVHRARRSSPLVLRRIQAAPQGGGRTHLPPELRLACHDRLTKTDATSIYGRIDPNKPSPTMTTRCTTPSCGRFIHPYEDRGLTLREAAVLQTFPASYAFEGHHQSVERQIGNAVPVHLAEALGLVVRALCGSPADEEAEAA